MTANTARLGIGEPPCHHPPTTKIPTRTIPAMLAKKRTDWYSSRKLSVDER
jgi:hypothetical protein